MPDRGWRDGGVDRGPRDGGGHEGLREAVRVRDLTKKFGSFVAVDGASFHVEAGEIFGFLGPNGAGKTTTLRMLIGVLPPTSGEGRVAGHGILTEGEAIRRSIGYMSQRFSLYGDLTVDENIRLFGGLYEVAGERFRARREWILEMAGLGDRVGQLAASLPLGWKQRLALGCALLHEPPLLVLDEPTSGVDPVARRSFWELINGLAEGGTTILVSTHYMEEAEHCNRVVLMNRGRIIASDTPEGLRGSMTEPLLELRTPDAPGAVEALREAGGVLEAAMFGRGVHVVVEDEAWARHALPSLLAARGLALEGMKRVPPSLEDVFVALVRKEGGAVEG
jgi:ABC-2 type transport system ATP-binding protein